MKQQQLSLIFFHVSAAMMMLAVVGVIFVVDAAKKTTTTKTTTTLPPTTLNSADAAALNETTILIDFFGNESNFSLSADEQLNVTYQLLKDAAKEQQQPPPVEKLNQTHGDAFKSWLDAKSAALYQMSISYSGYKILNSTYQKLLKKNIEYKWINFTSMIMNISSTISDVLKNKALLVQNLTDLVERTFEEYRLNQTKINQSLQYSYYDAKSPLTFCDTAESYKKKINETKMKAKALPPAPPPPLPPPQKTTETETTQQPRSKRAAVRSTTTPPSPLRTGAVRTSPIRTTGPVRTTAVIKATSTAVTTTIETPSVDEDQLREDYFDGEEVPDDETAVDFETEEDYWDMPCINRTYDENFKAVQKINTNKSTVHVPTNIYKKDMAINMTAFWTESLNEQFKKNYAGDSELFWQYFCSSQGLFRRYPGAYWSLQQTDDFFDCRLQSWYVSAAASPKDVVFMLDTSGSMTGLRLEIGKRLIEFIMDTFTDNDFFNIFTFNSTAQYLMSESHEAEYRDKLVQAGKANKQKFIEKLNSYKATNSMAMLNEPLQTVFEFLNKTSTGGCRCNQAVMIITDGSTDNTEDIFERYNLDKRVRIFSFKIGRDMTDSNDIKKIACDNNGEYYHVVTLTDINEHVYEYIPVLSRPMALSGVHVTTWSNVFVGHLDKELKIAVARPAFRNRSSFKPKYRKRYNYTKIMREMKHSSLSANQSSSPQKKGGFNIVSNFFKEHNMPDDFDDEDDEDDEDENEAYAITTNDEEKKKMKKSGDSEFKSHEEHLQKTKKQNVLKQVLLGVVGVDVPVLRLISKVSPKYQMGVGIYIIMLDNNGFIVFHPSIKREITKGAFDFKGSSHSIDLDKFEIPIDNEDEFEDLEHEMIDQKTNKKTLKNWKREGLRVIKRSTEYVYTPIKDTPFSVAIASPSSFGRYYIDLPSSKEREFDEALSQNKASIKSSIQLYNCTYNLNILANRITKLTTNDYCIRYLFVDTDQVLAIKSDLVLHENYYSQFMASTKMFDVHKNLVKSSFYGTYSGITFYLPVTFYRPKSSLMLDNDTNATAIADLLMLNVSNISNCASQTSTNDFNYNGGTAACVVENVDLEPIQLSLNLFSTESNKHTYSFEKQYYTRTIEFSDYLRTEFNYYDPLIIYFLNETSKDARQDTLSATTSLWLDKVPAAVSGVVYDSDLLENLLFDNFSIPNCPLENCHHLCNRKRGMKITCYLVDEHGIVVLSNTEQQVINKALHLVNPWLMKRLELEGIYNLIIPGENLDECEEPVEIHSAANMLKSLLGAVLKSVSFVVYQSMQLVLNLIDQVSFSAFFVGHNYSPLTTGGLALVNAATKVKVNLTEKERREELNRQNKFRFRNSLCYYFGIYSFNFTRWQSLDASELRVWCNEPKQPKRFLVGYIKQSNLIMLVVEDQETYTKCGSIANYTMNSLINFDNDDNITSSSASSNNNGTAAVNDTSSIAMALSSSANARKNSKRKSSSSSNSENLSSRKVNRYRKEPESCHSYFPNESIYVACKKSSASSPLTFTMFTTISSSKSFLFFKLVEFYLTIYYLITVYLC